MGAWVSGSSVWWTWQEVNEQQKLVPKTTSWRLFGTNKIERIKWFGRFMLASSAPEYQNALVSLLQRLLNCSQSLTIRKCTNASWLLFYNLKLKKCFSNFFYILNILLRLDIFLTINFYSLPLWVQNLFTPNLCLGCFLTALATICLSHILCMFFPRRQTLLTNLWVPLEM